MEFGIDMPHAIVNVSTRVLIDVYWNFTFEFEKLSYLSMKFKQMPNYKVLKL